MVAIQREHLVLQCLEIAPINCLEHMTLFEIVHVLERHSNHYFSQAIEKPGTERGLYHLQSIKGLTYSTE